MSYRPGDYWLTDDRSAFDIRKSRTVVEAKTGFVVEEGTEDPRHPLEARIKPRKGSVPDLVRVDREGSFVAFTFGAFLLEGFALEGFQVS